MPIQQRLSSFFLCVAQGLLSSYAQFVRREVATQTQSVRGRVPRCCSSSGRLKFFVLKLQAQHSSNYRGLQFAGVYFGVFRMYERN